jgi:P27 family predicted phage terminase small subunit
MKNKAPIHLSKDGQALWSELQHEYDISDKAGVLLLTTAMEARDRLKEAAAIIKKEGLQLPDRFGQMKAHPLTTVERDSRAAMLSALKALNLDLEPLNDRPGRPAGK